MRLRFASEVWDVTLLEPNTEVGVDLLEYYTRTIDYHTGEAPVQEAYLTVLKGKAGLKFDYREFPDVAAPAVVHWDNKGVGTSDPQPIAPRAMPTVTALWSKTPPAGATQPQKDGIQRMRDALASLSGLMSEKKAVDSALLEARHSDDSPTLRILAVYSFGAVDDIDKVLDVLCNDDAEAHAADRTAAIFTLRRWLAHNPDNGNRLYDAKKDTGVLTKYDRRSSDAQATLDLLHDFSDEDARKLATFDFLVHHLRSDQLAVRELAYWQLRHLSLGARVALPDYNAAWDSDKRNAAADAWKALIGKELPPTTGPAAKPMPQS